jgi:hypothetical protein
MDMPSVLSAIFAGLALIVSFVAAFIAHDSRVAADRSADSAERANDINLHQSRLDIYRAFQAFHGALVQRGPLLAESDVFPFLGTAHLSEFYFPESLHKRLQHIADDALTYLSKAEDLRRANEVPDLYTRPERTNLRAMMNAQHKTLREVCVQVDELLRAELRLFKRSSPLP